MIDNESITLLASSKEVKKCLREASRVLRPNGILELITKNRRFDDGFYPGLEQLGFELLTKKDEGFAVSKSMQKRLKAIHGEHFAESYASKLANTYMILARKIKDPNNPSSKLFLFGLRAPGSDNEDYSSGDNGDNQVRDPSESKSIVNPRGRRKGAKPSRHTNSVEVVSPKRIVTVDRDGFVTSVKKIEISGGSK